METHSAGHGESLPVSNNRKRNWSVGSWIKRPFDRKSKNALAFLFVVGVVFWAVLVPGYADSWSQALLEWLQQSK